MIDQRPQQSRMPLFTRIAFQAKGGALALLFLVPFFMVLSTLLVYIAVREEHRDRDAQMAVLRETAAALYEQVAIARLWNAQHGGVYVRITPQTRPNPYLPAPGREITARDGTRYALINPAYMTRQFSEIAAEQHGNAFRLVGLRPLNPANVPDAWERQALDRVMQPGVTEYAQVSPVDAHRRWYRYFVPLRIAPPCLACHAGEGYHVGDVKGGVSIGINMEQYDAILAQKRKRSVLSLAAVGAAIVLLTALIVLPLSFRLSAEIRKNVERERLAASMELAGAAAHELRQPMTVVQCIAEVMKKDLDGRGKPSRDMDIIREQCARMDGIISKLLQLTRHRSKRYLEGIDILDLDASSGPGDGPSKRNP